jgi:hypothetical protein
MGYSPDSPAALQDMTRRRTTVGMIPEDIDLEELRRKLSARFSGAAPAGYVRGKGDLRAAVLTLLDCSALEAEQLVDTMEGRGLIRYEGDRQEEVDQLERHWDLGQG